MPLICLNCLDVLFVRNPEEGREQACCCVRNVDCTADLAAQLRELSLHVGRIAMADRNGGSQSQLPADPDSDNRREFERDLEAPMTDSFEVKEAVLHQEGARGTLPIRGALKKVGASLASQHISDL